MIRGLTLRQLRILREAAETLSITQTARRVHLTGPAVTMQVRQLETACGLPLFDRVGKRLALTGAGRSVCDAAVDIFTRLDFLESQLQALHGLEAGLLRIGLLSTGKYFVPRLLARFHERHPAVELRLIASNRETLTTQILQGEVDIALMGRVPPGLPVVREPFAANPQVAIARPGHPLAGERAIPPIELRREVFVQREEGSGTRAVLDEFLALHRIEPRARVTVTSNEMVKQAVMAGLGVSVVAIHTLGLELAARVLSILDVEHTPIQRHWYVVHHAQRSLSPAAAAFRDFLIEEGAADVEAETRQLLLAHGASAPRRARATNAVVSRQAKRNPTS